MIRILLIIVVIGCLTHTSWGQENGIVNISHPSSLPARSAFSDEDILNHAQKSLDRSIGILNTVATLMGVLVALLTLIVIIGAAWGIFESRQLKEFKQKAKESADEAKEYADEAKKDAEEAKPIIERLKKTEEEVGTLREKTMGFPPLPEALSEDQKKILDDYGRKIEFLEAFGLPLKSEDYLNRGAELYQRGEYELALKAFDKAIELKPDYAAAWHNRGVVLGKLGRHDEALKAHDKAIGLKHDFASAWYNKACTYYRKADKENALKNLSKAIDLDAKYKEEAKSDEDFKNLWDDEDFKRIVS